MLHDSEGPVGNVPAIEIGWRRRNTYIRVRRVASVRRGDLAPKPSVSLPCLGLKAPKHVHVLDIWRDRQQLSEAFQQEAGVEHPLPDLRFAAAARGCQPDVGEQPAGACISSRRTSRRRVPITCGRKTRLVSTALCVRGEIHLLRGLSASDHGRWFLDERPNSGLPELPNVVLDAATHLGVWRRLVGRRLTLQVARYPSAPFLLRAIPFL